MQKIQTIKFLFFLFIIISFLAGGYFYIFREGLQHYEYPENTENTDTISSADNTTEIVSEENSCPDLLIKSGSTLLLIHTKLPRSDTNPLPFYSLDEYINYMDIQKSMGNTCPVLLLQEEVNAQGHMVYRVRSNINSYEGALPDTANVYNNTEGPYKYIDSNRDSSTYNINNYPGFDPTGLYVGRYSELDQIHDSTNMMPISDNPMDPNWGGIVYTHNSVLSGKYIGNEVNSTAGYQNELFEEPADRLRVKSKENSIYA
jgi:hypothetical protein